MQAETKDINSAYYDASHLHHDSLPYQEHVSRYAVDTLAFDYRPA